MLPHCWRKPVSVPLVLLAAALSAGARKREPPLPVALNRTVAQAKGLDSAFIGLHVVQLKNGKSLYGRNQGRLFSPASNTKLFTTALALKRLGPNYRFVTSVTGEQAIDSQGKLRGGLTLTGRGDPTLSGRPYPYVADWTSDDPLKPIQELADQLIGHGLKAVEGDVVGDDTRYPWRPYSGSWDIGDTIFESGAPVSALIVNDNAFTLTISPGGVDGAPASFEMKPAFELFRIDNHVRTITQGPRRIKIDGRLGDPYLRIWGSIALGDSVVERLAITDPALFSAAVLRDALVRRGVRVSGQAVARHRYLDELADPERGEETAAPAGVELARRESPPLSELLQVVDKVSENLHAEVMLREVGAARRGMGTTEAGIAELRDFLAEVGISDEQYSFVDGSGLSRRTLVSPQAVTRLLAYMYASPERELWIGLLPIGSEDGTLQKRFKGHPEAKAIHAKTGSLSHVRALSGYAESKRFGTLAFSVLVNNYLAPDADVTRFLDTIGLKLLP